MNEELAIEYRRNDLILSVFANKYRNNEKVFVEFLVKLDGELIQNFEVYTQESIYSVLKTIANIIENIDSREESEEECLRTFETVMINKILKNI